MRRRWLLVIACCVLTSPAFGKDDRTDMMRGAKLNEPRPPAPTLVVGANELAESMAEPGWPVIVSAALLSEDGQPGPVPETLQVRVLDDHDRAVPLAFEAVEQDRPDGEPQRFWIAAASATQALAPGQYQVTLEPAEGLTVEPADLVVVAANPEHAAARGALEIQRLLLLGHDDEALAEAERQIAADAQNADAWIAKGDMLMAKDLPDEALLAYEKALELQRKTNDDPLFVQERHRAALFRSLEKRGVLKADTQP